MSDALDLTRPIQVPEKPALEGLEKKWSARWEADGTYRFDRTKRRAAIYSIDTPPPTVSGINTVSAVFRTTSRMILRRSYEAVISRKVSSSPPSAS